MKNANVEEVRMEASNLETARMKESNLQLVIFDLDGVIVSTDHYHYQAWQAIADAERLAFDQGVNHLLRGVSRKESLEIILAHNGVTVDEGQFNQMLESKNALYQQALGGLSPEAILPGVMALLEGLKARGVLVAIGSSSRNTPLILEKIGLANAFDAVVDGNGIRRSKPHPEVFLKCADQLGISPAHCVVVEDAQAGVQAARAAGMRVLGVGHHQHDLHLAHGCVVSLAMVDYGVLADLCDR